MPSGGQLVSDPGWCYPGRHDHLPLGGCAKRGRRHVASCSTSRYTRTSPRASAVAAFFGSKLGVQGQLGRNTFSCVDGTLHSHRLCIVNVHDNFLMLCGRICCTLIWKKGAVSLFWLALAVQLAVWRKRRGDDLSLRLRPAIAQIALCNVANELRQRQRLVKRFREVQQGFPHLSKSRSQNCHWTGWRC